MEKSAIREIWHDVRNLCEDEKRELPSGVYGPFYNDRFDDVYGSVYAVTGDGYSYEEMREAAENTRRLLMQVPSVQKVELLGEQEEKVYVEVKLMSPPHRRRMCQGRPRRSSRLCREARYYRQPWPL